MSLAKTVLRVLLPVAALGTGLAIAVTLVRTKPVPAKEERKDLGTLVEVQRVKPERRNLVVQAQGSVTPSRQVNVQPEVQGRVIWKNPSLVPGGRFKKGEVLLRIDPRQYAIEAKQQGVSITQAEQALAIEKARKDIASEEWKIINQDGAATETGRAVALREPHLRQAEANVQSAKNAQSLARLNIGRTTLKAPFNGFVQATTIDVGQLVSPQSQLGTLVGSDSFWIQTSIPVVRLKSIRVPGLNAKEGEGSPALVWQDIGGQRIEREGKVVRLLGDLDPVGRMARVLVRVDDPLNLKQDKVSADETAKDAKAETMPLLVGAYVHVEIDAEAVVDVVEIPRLAVRGGDRVHVYDDGVLATREIEIVWRNSDSVLVDGGLEPQDLIITSRIPTPIEGMRLRVQENGKKATAQASKP